MSDYVLGKMLASAGRLFEFMIDNFEKSTGEKAIDVALLGEMTAQASMHLRTLGLSPEDTLPEELTLVLLNKFLADAKAVNYQVIGDNRDLNFFNSQLMRLLNNILEQKVLRLSERTLVSLVNNCPPAKLMKKLRINSVSQLVSSFNLVEFLTIAWEFEPDEWRQQLVHMITNLSPEHFEYQKINFITIDPRLLAIDKRRTNFIRNSLLGTIIFKPYRKQLSYGILSGLIEGLQSAKKMIDESNQLQLLVMSQNHQSLIGDWLLYRSNIVWHINGSILPWRSVMRALAEPGELQNELLQSYPDLTLGRLDISDEIFEQFPTLKFWEKSDYLAFRHNQQVVSLSLLDLADSEYSAFEYGTHQEFSDALWDELLRRYLNEPALTARLMLFLRTQVIEK